MGGAMIKRTAVLLLALFALSACVVSTPNSPKPETAQKVNCPPLPTNFKESDLMGKWSTKYDGASDTLILREDQFYRQIYDNPKSGFHYESDWLPWNMEQRKSGLVRLHLKGMRRCDGTGEYCTREGGGLGGPSPDVEYYAIDECEGGAVKMPDEIILIATGTPETAIGVPRGIWLRHMRLPGSEWNYVFQLQEE